MQGRILTDYTVFFIVRRRNGHSRQPERENERQFAALYYTGNYDAKGGSKTAEYRVQRASANRRLRLARSKGPQLVATNLGAFRCVAASPKVIIMGQSA